MTDGPGVVVIGGGLGGLTAGATLAKLGHRVLLLEQHYVPGGCATTFRRKDYLMEVGLHEMDGLDALDPKLRILDFLGIGDHVTLVQVPELFRVITGGGRDFVFPHGEAESCEALCREFPHQQKAIRAFRKLVTGVRREVARLPESPWARALLLPFFPLLFPRIVRTSGTPLGKYLDAHFSDERLKLILTANIGYYHDDPCTMSLFYFVVAQGGYIHGGGHFIRGGSQRLSDSLAGIIRAGGGVVLTGKTATAIHTRDGRVSGVTFRDTFNGAMPPVTTETRHVVANAAPDIIAGLLPAPHDARLRKRIAPLEQACSLLTVYLGLDRDPAAFGSRHYSTFLGQEHIRTLRDVRPAMQAGLDRRPFVFVDYSRIDSGLAPPGKAFGCICAVDYLSGWEGLDEQGYKARKREVAERLIARLDEFLPGCREAVVHHEVATPVTIRAYTRNPGGTPYGFAQIAGQDSNRRFGEWAPVGGLHFASAWGFPGAGFSGAIIGGYLCAQKVHRQAGTPASAGAAYSLDDSRSVRVMACRQIARDTCEITVGKPADFAPAPGQYAFVRLDTPGEMPADIPLRPLSIVSSADEAVVRFAMRLSDSGFKKACLSMKPGDRVTLFGPTGGFLLPGTPVPVVFLAGGIGITPVIPMLRALEAQGFPERTHLVCSARDPDSMAYRDELDGIVHANYTFHKVFTATRDRIGAPFLRAAVGDPGRYRYYIVGSAGFLSGMEAVLSELGVPPGQRTVDDFG